MFYLIYKITNTINNKIYIGKHQTTDLQDGYMGSGKLLHYAIKKYGPENFTKEILWVFDNEADMNAKEAEIVTNKFVSEKTNYNLCPGGRGGFGYINNNEELRIAKNKKARAITNSRHKDKLSDWGKLGNAIARERHGVSSKFIQAGRTSFLGKKHTEETKEKIGRANSQLTGSRNSQYGSMWITNGKENKKVRKTVDAIPDGWYKGRVI